MNYNSGKINYISTRKIKKLRFLEEYNLCFFFFNDIQRRGRLIKDKN